MLVTAAHEGVIASPRGQLWVLDPHAARSNQGRTVGVIRARVAAHRRSRLLRQAGGFAVGAVLGTAVAWFASYNPLGFAVLAVTGGALVAGLVVPKLFAPAAALASEIDGGQVAPLFPLAVYGVAVTDTVSWDTLWILARNFSALFRAEVELGELLERSADEPVGRDEHARRAGSIEGLRTEALTHAASVWVPVSQPRGHFVGVSEPA